jgi:predicted MFS family arabinose efflux permease
LALIALFFLIEAKVRHPLVPLGVFRSRDLVGSGLVALAFQATTNAPLLLCILYLQEVIGLQPARAGLTFVPFNLAVIAGSFLGSRLTRGIRARLTAACGLFTVAGGVLLARISPEGGYPGVLLPGFVLIRRADPPLRRPNGLSGGGYRTPSGRRPR